MRNILSWLCLVIILGLSACSGPGSDASKTVATPRASKTAQGICAQKGRAQLARSVQSLLPVQGEWPLMHGDLARDGASSAAGPAHLQAAWSFCIGASMLSSPIVSGGRVYISATNGTLTALDARSARQLWQQQADGALYATPALVAGVLYTGSLAGSVYAIQAASGRVLWRSAVDGAGQGARIWSSPVVVNGLVIVGVASDISEHPKVAGELLAFDAQTGARHWRTWTLPGGQPGGGIWSSPAVDVTQQLVYVGTGDPDDGAQALSLSDGSLRWHWRSVVRDVGDTDVGAGPTLYHDQQGLLRVAVAGKDGALYSLDAANGRLLWRTVVGNQVYGTPAFARGLLFVTGVLIRRSTTWGIDASTGQPRWQHANAAIVYASAAVDTGQTLYLGLGDGFVQGPGGLVVLETASGRLVQQVDLRSGISSSPALVANWLFVGSQNGNLYAFVRSDH